MNRVIRTFIGTLCKSYCILCGHTEHCGCYFYRGGLSHCRLTNYRGRRCALWACQLALTRPIVTTVTGSSITPPPLTLCHPPPLTLCQVGGRGVKEWSMVIAIRIHRGLVGGMCGEDSYRRAGSVPSTQPVSS